MFKKITQEKLFWKAVLIFAVVFIVLFNLARIFFEFNFSFSTYYEYYFNAQRLPSFIALNLIGAFVYGFFTAYYKFWKHFKTHS